MANSYTQAYFQIVFAVRNRKALIHDSWKLQLEKYITEIVQSNGHKLMAIGAVSDHVHIFIGYNVNQTIPKLVEVIKVSTNKWIAAKGFLNEPFTWQLGYGAFTYSPDAVPNVIRYVLNQEEHHHKKSFKEEYAEFLKEFEVDYKEKYLFDYFDDSEKEK